MMAPIDGRVEVQVSNLCSCLHQSNSQDRVLLYASALEDSAQYLCAQLLR